MRTLACLLACPPVLHLGVHGQGGFFFGRLGCGRSGGSRRDWQREEEEEER